MKRVVFLLIVAFVALVLFYVSRFWPFAWWGRGGLFGIEALHPRGGLVGRWLRGTPFAPFELVIWATGSFLILTWIQKLYDLVTTPREES